LFPILAVVIYSFVNKEEEYEDNPFVINFASKFSDRHAYGIQKNIVQGKGDRNGVTYSPRDINYKLVDSIKDKTIYAQRNKIVSLSKGSWSGQKNINIILPPKSEDFPDGIKDSDIGKALMLLTEIKNSNEAEVAMLREGNDRMRNILPDIGDGELSAKHISKINVLFGDLVKIAAKGKEREERKMGFPEKGSD